MLHSKTGNTQSTRLSFMAPMEPVGIPIPNNPRPAPSVFPNFQSYLRSQSDAVQGILGNELDNYSDANLTSFATSLLSCDGISIFGDGSVKEGRGAHATRIYASATFLDSESSIETAAITSSGDPSLRSETSSTLGGLYMLYLIRTHFNIAVTASMLTFLRL